LSSGPWLFSRNLLLKEMAGGDEAAETADAAEATKANVREQAEQYARLRIAIAVLRGQIEAIASLRLAPNAQQLI
jgi:uncharacterized protein YhaN